MHMTVSGQTRKARHPGDGHERGQVAHSHVIRAVRAHTKAPQREPAKPAPSVSTISRCSAGTALALAEPWMSTNCARMYLMLLASSHCFASAGVMCASPLLGCCAACTPGVRAQALPPRTSWQMRRVQRKHNISTCEWPGIVNAFLGYG